VDTIVSGLTQNSTNKLPFDPVEYAAQFLRIMDKRDHIIPLTYNPLQRKYLAERTERDLILKPRQIGFSTAIQAEHYRIETTETARTLTLADSDENTQKLRRMADRFYDQFPADLKPKRGRANATLTTYLNYGSEATIATAGNRNSGRAGSYRFIHCSEAAFYPDLHAIVASALQAGSPEWVVLESTPNGASGYFYELCMEALDPKSGSPWKLHFYRWFDNPEYAIVLLPGERIEYTDDEAALVAKHGLTPQQIKWRRLKQKELGFYFQQEYPEDVVTCFLSSGSGVFGDIRHAVYTPPVNDACIPGHLYIGGVDWGQEVNYSSLSIIDATANREVFLGRWNRMRWDEQRRNMINALCKWKVQKVHVEKNSASSNVENLRDELEVAQREWDIKEQTSVVAFNMTNKLKSELVGAMYQGIHEDGLKLLDIPYASAEMREFTTKQTASGAWAYDSPLATDGGHGDTVIARMAAYWGVLRRVPDEW
jgi:hypothetical protein